MKPLGISALITVVLSFIFWLVNWSYWFYMDYFAAPPIDYDSRKPIRYIMQAISVSSILLEYLSLLLIATALIIGAKRLLPKN